MKVETGLVKIASFLCVDRDTMIMEDNEGFYEFLRSQEAGERVAKFRNGLRIWFKRHFIENHGEPPQKYEDWEVSRDGKIVAYLTGMGYWQMDFKFAMDASADDIAFLVKLFSNNAGMRFTFYGPKMDLNPSVH